MIKFNFEGALDIKELETYQREVSDYHLQLSQRTGLGSDFLGWLSWPQDYDKAEYARLKETAKIIREEADVLLVCGIGGSYLGSRSAIEMINGLYKKNKPEVIFVGNTLSSTYLSQVLDYIKGKSVFMNVISKSGTTTETAVAFELLRRAMEETYGEKECKHRIIATTDKHQGTLRDIASLNGYRLFTIPDNIGGRYSVLTSVGLLPIAVAGIDTDDILRGAYDAMKHYENDDLRENEAYRYAVARRILDKRGLIGEMLITYELQLVMFAEWWKQLFGESEGKQEKGLLPLSCCFTTDLHSMGQYIQEGTKCLFETVLCVEKPQADLKLPHLKEEALSFLSEQSVDHINRMACQGTLEAHQKTAKIPNLIITIPEISPYSYGYLTYFFFLSCAMSGYLLNINPFNQPGVEVYKKNMFKLLGKK